jgi:indole-3-glycerol phosphate synthase
MKTRPHSDSGTAPEAMTFLEEILSSTRAAVQSAKRGSTLSELKKRVRDREPPRGFAEALSDGTDLKLIAEVKQASPSRGVLRHPFDPVEIARIYEEEGAAAVSILTEERYFRGSLEHLSRVRSVIKIPMLRKDFVIDEYQVYEARVFDADAVLLIAAILDDSRLKDYQALAWELGMAGLVEVHTELEKERALRAGARIIGINNRDLSTFKTDLETTFRLIRDIPDDRIVISESGISERKDVERIREAGTDAVLIGESFITSADIRVKIQGLFGR